MYSIDRNHAGSQADIFVECDEHFVRFDGTNMPGTLGSLLQVTGKKIDLAPENILAAAQACGIPPQHLGLKHLVRPAEFDSLITDFQDKVDKAVAPFASYVPHYSQNIKTLNSCSRIKLRTAPEGVSLDSGGFIDKIVYDTSHTKTGRMSVVSGYNVLTAGKEFKKLIVSRFAGGKIVEIDYSALEPRVALAASGSQLALVPDVYTDIGNKIGLSDRGTVKQLIISFLYGAGNATMRRLTNLSDSALNEKLKIMAKLFKRKEIVRDLRQQLSKSGYFLNHAGRPVFPGSEKEGLLFNNYCQSSAVDVAISGFTSLLEQINELEMKAVPLCFIHDAIILDVPGRELSKITDISGSLSTYLGLDFPTKLSIVNI